MYWVTYCVYCFRVPAGPTAQTEALKVVLRIFFVIFIVNFALKIVTFHSRPEVSWSYIWNNQAYVFISLWERRKNLII